MTDEHQPNTFRTWLPRIWKASCDAVEAHPDWALVTFLVIVIIAAIL